MVSAERSAFPFQGVVLVADIFDKTASNAPLHQRRDLEKTDTETLASLSDAIRALGLELRHHTGPDALAANAERYSNYVVLAIYGGQGSRNRMALVPAICEAFGLRFVGPDVYGRIAAQDKEISKRLALECGLRTPAWRLVRNERDLAAAESIRTPVVVKPVFEGSSIGLTQRNRVTEPESVQLMVRALLTEFNQPILVEEFVAGREVAYTAIQDRNESRAFSEIIIADDPTYFVNHLFDAHDKQFRAPSRTVRNIDIELDPNDRSRIEAFLLTFGTYGYCRVDGRLSADGFSFIEMTPDAWLSPIGQFAMSFSNKGWSYQDVIAAVLSSVR